MVSPFAPIFSKTTKNYVTLVKSNSLYTNCDKDGQIYKERHILAEAGTSFNNTTNSLAMRRLSVQPDK